MIPIGSAVFGVFFNTNKQTSQTYIYRIQLCFKLNFKNSLFEMNIFF